MDVILYHNVHDPFSERAKRALGEKGIFQERREIRWDRLGELAASTGTNCVPTLVSGDEVLSGAGAIARWANRRMHGGVDFFPADSSEAIDAWERRADELITLTMPLVLPVWADVLTDRRDREAFLARFQPKYGEYQRLRKERLENWRRVEAEWKRFDADLGDNRYLVGRLTYADIAMYGSVYCAAQFHAYEVPEVNRNLAAWYEAMRTEGIMRDQEVLLGHSRQGHRTHDIDYTRAATRYGDPPHRPKDGSGETY